MKIKLKPIIKLNQLNLRLKKITKKLLDYKILSNKMIRNIVKKSKN